MFNNNEQTDDTEWKASRGQRRKDLFGEDELPKIELKQETISTQISKVDEKISLSPNNATKMTISGKRNSKTDLMKDMETLLSPAFSRGPSVNSQRPQQTSTFVNYSRDTNREPSFHLAFQYPAEYYPMKSMYDEKTNSRNTELANCHFETAIKLTEEILLVLPLFAKSDHPLAQYENGLLHYIPCLQLLNDASLRGNKPRREKLFGDMQTVILNMKGVLGEQSPFVSYFSHHLGRLYQMSLEYKQAASWFAPLYEKKLSSDWTLIGHRLAFCYLKSFQLLDAQKVYETLLPAIRLSDTSLYGMEDIILIILLLLSIHWQLDDFPVAMDWLHLADRLTSHYFPDPQDLLALKVHSIQAQIHFTEDIPTTFTNNHTLTPPESTRKRADYLTLRLSPLPSKWSRTSALKALQLHVATLPRTAVFPQDTLRSVFQLCKIFTSKKHYAYDIQQEELHFQFTAIQWIEEQILPRLGHQPVTSDILSLPGQCWQWYGDKKVVAFLLQSEHGVIRMTRKTLEEKQKVFLGEKEKLQQQFNRLFPSATTSTPTTNGITTNTTGTATGNTGITTTGITTSNGITGITTTTTKEDTGEPHKEGPTSSTKTNAMSGGVSKSSTPPASKEDWLAATSSSTHWWMAVAVVAIVIPLIIYKTGK